MVAAGDGRGPWPVDTPHLNTPCKDSNAVFAEVLKASSFFCLNSFFACIRALACIVRPLSFHAASGNIKKLQETSELRFLMVLGQFNA